MKKTTTCCQPKKILILHIGFLVLLTALIGLAYWRYGIVATVNGQVISRLSLIRSLENQGKKQTLESLIQENLVLQEAKKKGITIDQNTIDAEILKIEEQLKKQELTLKTALESRGITQKDLEHQIVLQKMLEQLVPKTEITQEQIDKFIKDNKSYFPKDSTKAELEEAAKEELGTQQYNEALTTWLKTIASTAKIVYR